MSSALCESLGADQVRDVDLFSTALVSANQLLGAFAVLRSDTTSKATLSRRRLLYGTSAVCTSAACASRPAAVFSVSRPDPARFNACPVTPPGALRLLTWNIFMMPRWLHESPRNEARAAAMGAALLSADVDILCLQKAFDASSRQVLERVLSEVYPYRYGPANDSCSLRINSGVWILSKTPLADYQEIEFEHCRGVECLSRKGAVLVSATCGANIFRLIVTHLQGEEGSSFTAAGQQVRDAQMLEIRERLIEPNLEPGVPFFICGDMGTPRFAANLLSETASYRRMLATFAAENGGDPRITLDESRYANDLALGDGGRQNELDYVLARPNGARVSVDRVVRVFQRSGWDVPPPGRHNLSYRHAVSAIISFATSGAP